MRRVEARSWLRNSRNTSPFGGNRFEGKQEAVDAVEKLYAAGASLVEIELELDDSYSEVMIVHGSEDTEAPIFQCIGTLCPNEAYYERGSFFWRLWWD